MSVTFYVGEQPLEPLIISVTDRNLTGLDVSLVGDPLPENIVSIANPTTGRVQVTFLAPFTDAGIVTVQLKLDDGSEEGDYTDPVEITVADVSETMTLLVTPIEVETATAVAVSSGDIARAQALVSLVMGRNLEDADWLETVSSNDLFWIRSAIMWQASEIRTSDAPEDFVMPHVPGVSSISNGDISISYTATSADTAESLLSLQASMALRRLTWMGNFRSVQAKPFLGGRCEPSRWVPMYRTSM